MSCPLCNLSRETEWFYEGPTCAVLLCRSCKVPMCVLKRHSVEPRIEELLEMANAIRAVADEFFGEGNYYVDTTMRSIPEHLHYHARPKER